MPDILQGLKWHVQFCLRVPPSAAPIVPVGNPAIHIVRLKILFFVSFFLSFYRTPDNRKTFTRNSLNLTATNHTHSIPSRYGLERFTIARFANGLRCQFEYYANC